MTKIYTSYFGRVKKLPKDIVPIAICGGVPFYWNGLWYKKVAPKRKFFLEWKENHDNAFYIQHFNDEVLSKLNQDDVISDLDNLSGNADKICLICYEKPDCFCHRHLVAEWLNKTGKFNVSEWECEREDELPIG